MKTVIASSIVLSLSSLAGAGPTNESAKLTPIDIAGSDQFGISVSSSEGVAAIGARLDDDSGLNDGSVYLFDIETHGQILKLITSDNAQGGNFGISVAIEMLSTPPLVVVGKDRDRDNGINAGAVYLFRADTGSELFKIHEPTGTGGSLFGNSVDIEQNTIVVGATTNATNGSGAGRAYLFDATTGGLLHILEPQIPQNNSLFGNSVSISGDNVLVGARREEGTSSTSGVAYLFDRSTGLVVSRFFPADGDAGDQFGFAVSVEGNFAAISSPADGDNGSASGSVYIYDISTPTNPVQVQKLLAPDGSSGDEFGHCVAIRSNSDGYLVAVGAWLDAQNGSDAGSAYMFQLNAQGIMQSSTKLIASDASSNAEFGTSIAIDTNGAAIVGAAEDDALFTNAGAAYVFAFDQACVADFNGDGTLNFFDVSAFLAAFQANDPAADLTNDGSFNFFDVSEFLSAFSKGCP